MRKAVKAVITIAVLLLMFTSCQQRYIIPMPPISSGNGSKPSVTVPTEPTIPAVEESKTETLTEKEYSSKEISDMLSKGITKIVGAGIDKTIITLPDESTITKSTGTDKKLSVITVNGDLLILENLTVKGDVGSDGTTDDFPKGINVQYSESNTSKVVNIYLKNVKMENFGHAISSGPLKTNYESNSNLFTTNIYIIDSTFENCHKGLYINNLGDLEVFGSTFSKMGKQSTEGDVRTRSGSAFDINQFAEGGDIVFYDSTFTDCGGQGTSGAIKIKVRGGSDETATDIPSIDKIEGSFDSVLIQDCTFSGNNGKDLVLGTQSGADGDTTSKYSTYPKTLAANTKIINTSLQIKDESKHEYKLNSSTNTLYTDMTDTDF